MATERGGDGRLEAGKQRALSGLPDLSQLIRGSLLSRRLRCGKASCRCHAPDGQGHGPYWYLSLTERGGRSRSILIPAEQLAPVRAQLANWRRVARVLERVSEANWAALRAATARRRR